MNQTARGPAGADRPIPDLLKELASELKSLVSDELELVRIEMRQKGKVAGVSAGMFGAATIFGLGAFGAFTATLIALIANVLPLWVASLIVTLAYGIVAAVAALTGKNKLADVGSPVPGAAAKNVKRDVDAMKAGVERGR